MSSILRWLPLLGLLVASVATGASPRSSGPKRLEGGWLPLHDGIRWVYDAQRSNMEQIIGGGPGHESRISRVRVEGLDAVPGAPGSYRWSVYWGDGEGFDQRRPDAGVAWIVRSRAGDLVETAVERRTALGGPVSMVTHLPDPVLRLKRDARPGDRWPTTHHWGEEMLHSHTEVLGYEEVHVPAGTFSHCLKLRTSFSVKRPSGPSPPEEEIEIELVEWYAKGIGLVRQSQRVVSRQALPRGQSSVMGLFTELALREWFAAPPRRVEGKEQRSGAPDDERAQKTLLAALRGRDFAAADRLMGEVQREFERGKRTSSSVVNVASALRHAQPRTLDAWVDARPHSAFARLARGHVLALAGLRARGWRVVADTTDAQLQTMRRTFALALENFRTALEMEPNLVLAYRDRMSIHGYVGDYQALRSDFEALRRLESDPEYAYDRYLGYLRPSWGGSIQSMRALAREAELVHGPGALASRVRADLLMSLALIKERHHTPEAERLWDQAVQEDDASRAQRARFYVREGRFRDAFADLDRQIREHGLGFLELANRARAYRRLGYATQARADLQQASTLEPLNPYAPEELAALEEESGRPDAALAAWDRTAELAPDDTDVWKARAELLLRLGRPADAAASLDRALKLSPADPYLWYDYARALTEARDRRAAATLRRYLSMSEGARDQSELRGKARAMLGRLNSAAAPGPDPL